MWIMCGVETSRKTLSSPATWGWLRACSWRRLMRTNVRTFGSLWPANNFFLSIYHVHVHMGGFLFNFSWLLERHQLLNVDDTTDHWSFRFSILSAASLLFLIPSIAVNYTSILLTSLIDHNPVIFLDHYDICLTYLD